jgi:hypothetical protein
MCDTVTKKTEFSNFCVSTGGVGHNFFPRRRSEKVPTLAH